MQNGLDVDAIAAANGLPTEHREQQIDVVSGDVSADQIFSERHIVPRYRFDDPTADVAPRRPGGRRNAPHQRLLGGDRGNLTQIAKIDQTLFVKVRRAVARVGHQQFEAGVDAVFGGGPGGDGDTLGSTRRTGGADRADRGLINTENHSSSVERRQQRVGSERIAALRRSHAHPGLHGVGGNVDRTARVTPLADRKIELGGRLAVRRQQCRQRLIK